jgi:hypothetical protein
MHFDVITLDSDSRAIFYRQGSKILRVSVTTTPEFKARKPEKIRSAPLLTSCVAGNYRVSGVNTKATRGPEAGPILGRT